MSSPITVVLADDHSIMRDGLLALLRSTRQFDVLAMAEDGEMAVRLVREHRPNVLLMDINMPKVSGIDAIGSARRASPDTAVVVLTFHDEAHYIHAALDAGAQGYVLKDDSQADLFRAIESAAAGKSFISPSVTAVVVKGFLAKTTQTHPWDVLTQRELEVLRLIAEGLRTKAIALQLSLSPKTVEKHRANLMRKLSLKNVSEVTTFAIQHGLVE